ncbi:glutamine amidotransferase-related protein [Devosia chinhatensis]|uniref:Glutamine amidotransferase n=1 Tax=Devosia chinhatensis TaxID=429727 RepID=A0A0F5FFL6_9HYPH|nr:gamma-glutamyl-gamma-aminobutyrate hydrolase family protein [Devosia chinhatensis]KKB07385.1 glutamine amidotransferase [Devosia chinhatensis]
MKITIIEVGRVPDALRDRFVPYSDMFPLIFEGDGHSFTHDVVSVVSGQQLPDPTTLEGIVITGSSAGVYEDHGWLEPLRTFIREAYAARVPMLGICFGHQIMADALGGQVRKSEKGWGLGRHTYRVVERPDFMVDAPQTLSIACSHQDQVIEPPAEAEVILASDFTPNAGLAYKSGRALSFQPHPEFADAYSLALAELRRGIAADDVVEKALSSFDTKSDSALVNSYIRRFFAG